MGQLATHCGFGGAVQGEWFIFRCMFYVVRWALGLWRNGVGGCGAVVLWVCGLRRFAQDGGFVGRFAGGFVGGEASGGDGGLIAFVGVEVGGGDLEIVKEQAGALEIHAVAGQAGGDVGKRFLERGAVVEVLDEEGIVLDDGRNVVVAMLVADVLVVHGELAALDAVVEMLAAVRLRRLALESKDSTSCHGTPSRVYTRNY